MKLVFAAVVLALASPAMFASSITYSVTEAAGTQTASGTITTNGATGVLSQSDIAAFSFTISNGTASNTVSNTNGGTFVLAGNDLTATTSALLFNFGDTASGSGFALYDTNASNVLCVATPGTCAAAYGDNIVIALNDNYTQVNATATDQVIGTAQSSTVTPEPSSFFLLGTGALGAFATLRRRIFAR